MSYLSRKKEELSITLSIVAIVDMTATPALVLLSASLLIVFAAPLYLWHTVALLFQLHTSASLYCASPNPLQFCNLDDILVLPACFNYPVALILVTKPSCHKGFTQSDKLKNVCTILTNGLPHACLSG